MKNSSSHSSVTGTTNRSTACGQQAAQREEAGKEHSSQPVSHLDGRQFVDVGQHGSHMLANDEVAKGYQRHSLEDLQVPHSALPSLV